MLAAPASPPVRMRFAAALLSLAALLCGCSAPPRPAAPAPAPPEPCAEPGTCGPAQVIHRVTPAMPPEAAILGVRGDVDVLFTVDEEGRVRDLRVVSSAHPVLARAATEAVEQWRFRPWLKQGRP